MAGDCLSGLKIDQRESWSFMKAPYHLKGRVPLVSGAHLTKNEAVWQGVPGRVHCPLLVGSRQRALISSAHYRCGSRQGVLNYRSEAVG